MGLPASLAGAVGLAAYQGTKVALQRGPTQPESIKQNTHYKRPTTAEKLKITRKATCSGTKRQAPAHAALQALTPQGSRRPA